MGKRIHLSARAGRVYLAGENGLRIALTPELAIDLAVELPRFAAQARALAGQAINTDIMAETLTGLGFTWRAVPGDAQRGQWLQNDREAVDGVDDYGPATARVYSAVISPRRAVL